MVLSFTWFSSWNLKKNGWENFESRYYSVITVRGVASEIMTLDFWWSKLYLLQPQARKIKLRGGSPPPKHSNPINSSIFIQFYHLVMLNVRHNEHTVIVRSCDHTRLVSRDHETGITWLNDHMTYIICHVSSIYCRLIY